ncbi:MAG: alpha-amylase family protein [Planctomycetota bacterium]
MKRHLLLIALCLWLANGPTASAEPGWYGQHIRRIHMDFHTPEVAPEVVVKEFDAKRYVQTLKSAHVNSLVAFAKGHHGNSYYNTRLGHKHSGLPDDVDMLGEIITECHRQQIKVLAYYSVGWLTTVEQQHPEWMERTAAGAKQGTDGTTRTDSWNCICLNAPYLDEVVIPELEELVDNYDMDGVWIDIIENNPCYCQWCQAKHQREQGGADYNQAAAEAFASQTRREAVAKIVGAVKAKRPEMVISFNTAGRHPELVPLVDFCSVETHPGATWHQGAWSHAMLTMKCLQRFGKPWESTTSRFIHGWGGWDDQTTANMRAVASRIAAQGGVINLGDQTYPSGRLDPAIYEKIGEVYSHIKPMERWALGAEPLPVVGLFAKPFDIYSIYKDPQQLDKYLGATSILTDRHWQFDLVDEYAQRPLTDYAALILPNLGELDVETVTQLRDYVRQGGKLLVTGDTSLSASATGAEKRFALGDVLGVTLRGPSPYSVGYFDLLPAIAQNARASSLLVPGQFLEVAVSDGAQVLAKHRYPLIEPKPEELLFFRNNQLSPPGKLADSPAIVRHAFGKGEAIYVAAPIFEIYRRQSQWYLKDVASNLLDLLQIPQPVKLDAPDAVEMTLATKEDRLVVHLINYHLHKETNQVEEIIPVYDVVLKLDPMQVDLDGVEVIGEHQEFEVVSEGKTPQIRLKRLDVYSQVVLKLRETE